MRGRFRIDWPRVLRSAGFTDIQMHTRPEWHDAYTRIYRVALGLGDPGGDTLLADLQDEDRHRLPMADLIDRVAVTATAPDRAATRLGMVRRRHERLRCSISLRGG